MALWHFSEKTQRAERCHATQGNCPYGGGDVHVSGGDSEAKKFEANIVKEKYELFTPITKKSSIIDEDKGTSKKNATQDADGDRIKIKSIPKSKESRYVWTRKDKLSGYERISQSNVQEKMKLSYGELVAINSYTGAGYADINNYLRGVKINNDKIKQVMSDVRYLDRVFSRVPPLREDILVKRTQKGVFGFDFEKTYELGPNLDEEDKPRIRLDGYLSTSANSYSGEKGFNFTAGDSDTVVEMNIIVPKGMKILDINKHKFNDNLAYEQEILIQNGTVLIIDKLQYDPNDNKRVVYAHMAPAHAHNDTDRKFYSKVDLDAINSEMNLNNLK